MRILLVDDCIYSNSGFTCLTISNYQLSLSSTNWYHAINSLNSSLQWLIDRRPRHHAKSFSLNRKEIFCFNRSFPIDRLTQWINYTPKHCISDRNLNNFSCSLSKVSFLNMARLSKKNNPNVVILKVQSHPKNSIW